MQVAVSWPQQATDRLRLPRVCALTGAPAELVLDVPVRPNPFVGRFAIGALPLLTLLHKPLVVLHLPVTRAVAGDWRRWNFLLWFGRWLVLGAPLLLLAAGIPLAVATGDENLIGVGGVAMFAVIVAAIVLGLIGMAKANVFGVLCADGGVELSLADRGFAEALIAANPPGLVHPGPLGYGAAPARHPFIVG